MTEEAHGRVFGPAEYSNRLNRVLEFMERESLDVLILPADPSRPGDVAYFSGHFPWARLTYLLLGPNTPSPVLVTTMKSEAYWATERLDGLVEVEMVDDHDVPSTLARIVGRNADRVGVSQLHTLASARDLSLLGENSVLIDASALVQTVRMRKSALEITSMREGSILAQEALSSSIDMISDPDRLPATEASVFADIEHHVRDSGAMRTHMLTSDRGYLRMPSPEVKVRPTGQLMSLEFSNRSGYWVEEGTTLNLGERSDPVSDAIRVCEEAMVAVLESLNPGTACSEPARIFEKIVSRSRWQPGIWLGHGIGLDTAEMPFLRKDSVGEIQAGMVLAIHPHVVDASGSHGAYLAKTVWVGDDQTAILGNGSSGTVSNEVIRQQ